MLTRLCGRACPGLRLFLLPLPGLLALALIALAPIALAQEAPPLEAEGPPLAPLRTSAPAKPLPGKPIPGKPIPVKSGDAKAPQPVPRPGAPAVQGQKAALARPVARGPAVKNDGKRYLRSLDENHDARISREEFLAGAKKRFAKADLNNDGVISPQEAKAAKAKLQERKAKNDARRLAQGLPVKRKAADGKPPKPYLSSFDANHDGRVARKEYLAKRERKFAELDMNRDGVVSKEEAKAAKARLLARREERKAKARERAARTQARAALSAPAQPEAQPVPLAAPQPAPQSGQ